GLLTRRCSAESEKLTPSSKTTTSRRPSSSLRISLGQGSFALTRRPRSFARPSPAIGASAEPPVPAFRHAAIVEVEPPARQTESGRVLSRRRRGRGRIPRDRRRAREIQVQSGEPNDRRAEEEKF